MGRVIFNNMKYLYIILGILLGAFSWNFEWFFRGQEAIAAVQQVGNYDEYFASRTTMIFWDNLLTISKFVSVSLVTLGGYKIYKTKTKQQ